MTPVFLITGWSPVHGDRAYVEAPSALDAKTILDRELSERQFECTPLDSWHAIEMSRPIVVVIYQD